ncbi:MAG TPA: CatB-related O-acetyltransferase [Roseomonas sp.]|nr:CatB-related O-acetyltransferase [Roseomonas sp.]
MQADTSPDTPAPLDGLWRFILPDGQVTTEVLRFLPDGRLSGHPPAALRGWRMEAEGPCLLDEAGHPSIRLRPGEVAEQMQGFAAATGELLCRLERRDWETREGWEFLLRIQFRREIAEHGWEIGDHSYGQPVVHERLARLRIGKFTSIAEGVRIALGNHRTDSATTYPFAALHRFWPSAPTAPDADHATRGAVSIGHDVWIGAGAFIGSGVTIGDGAVIGAMAVVTRDVPPYAIVAGNPARLLRSRFPEPVVRALLALRWWDWPDAVVDRFLPRMLSGDVEGFIAAARAEGLGGG